MNLQEMGILTKMQYDVMNPEMYRPPPKLRHDTALSLLELSTVFIIEALGMVIGILAFIGERRRQKGTKNEFMVLGKVIYVQVTKYLKITRLACSLDPACGRRYCSPTPGRGHPPSRRSEPSAAAPRRSAWGPSSPTPPPASCQPAITIDLTERHGMGDTVYLADGTDV